MRSTKFFRDIQRREKKLLLDVQGQGNFNNQATIFLRKKFLLYFCKELLTLKTLENHGVGFKRNFE